jgi:hypothetical protein
MVEAGKLALIEFDNRFDSYVDGARRIFEVMCSAGPASCPEDHLRKLVPERVALGSIRNRPAKASTHI